MKKIIVSLQAYPTAILPRPIFSRFTRSSFPFPSPSDACHAGYPISKILDELSVKQDVEKFLWRVQLKGFFHDKEDDSNTSDKDAFETL